MRVKLRHVQLRKLVTVVEHLLHILNMYQRMTHVNYYGY